MRAFLLIVMAAMVSWPLLAAGADGPEPLAPLVPEEGKEGTREAYLTFTYRKTVNTQAETQGGKDNVGNDKTREQLTLQTTGRAVLVLPDRNYLDLRVEKMEGPDGKTLEIPMPEVLSVLWSSQDRAQKEGVKTYSGQTRVTGRNLYEHLGMNAWGRPEPKWARRVQDIQGSDSTNWSGKPIQGHSSYFHMGFSSQDPEGSFSFNSSSFCDIVRDECFMPPKWSDPHYRDTRPIYSTTRWTESLGANLPSWEREKQEPPPDEKDRWTRVVSRSKSGLKVKANRGKTLTTPPDGRFLGSTTKIDERLDIQLDLEAADYEILITPPEGLKDWIPNGGNNLSSPGDKLNFKGRVRKIKGTAAKDREVAVQVEVTSSRVPGRCMNWPKNGDREPDLRILRTGTTSKLKIESPDLADEERSVQQAHGVFKPDEEFTLVVGCYDYGAYGDISFGGSVPVRIEGYEPKVHINLPADENENEIADAWERSEGVFDKKLPPDWDDVAVEGQKTNGDGICLYERYRGFRNSTGGYSRLKCDRKYLFIYDPADLLRSNGASTEFMNASQLTPFFISNDQWTGPGSQGQDKRIVNFNHEGPKGPGPRHRVDQHALHLFRDTRRQPDGRDVPPPPGWQRAYAASGERPPDPQTGATLGCAWLDCVPYGRLGRSPLDTYQVSYYTDTIAGYAWTLALDAMPGGNYSEKNAALETYAGKETHKGEYSDEVKWFLQWVLCHELGHGVGMQHHVPVYGGDGTCYMRYPTRESYPPLADDPFWMRYQHWPSAFCRGGDGSVRPTNCFQHIQVTDYREGR